VNNRLHRRVITTLLLALIIQSPVVAMAKSKAKSTDKVTYSIFHAIPAGNGADKVDVYANNKLIVDNATPGAMATFTADRGNVQIRIYADGILPTSDTPAVLTSEKTYLANGANVTFVAHLALDGKPHMDSFRNMITSPGKKKAWLVVRHVAAAPAVDIRANGQILFQNLTNDWERKNTLAVKTYSVDAVLADSHTVVAISPINLTLQNESSTVVYAWGSAAQKNLKFAVQQIPVRKD
jgi:hypothetical protein